MLYEFGYPLFNALILATILAEVSLAHVLLHSLFKRTAELRYLFVDTVVFGEVLDLILKLLPTRIFYNSHKYTKKKY